MKKRGVIISALSSLRFYLSRASQFAFWREQPQVEHFVWDNGNGKGFRHKGEEYVHHSELELIETAFFNLLSHQKIFLAAAVTAVTFAFLFNWHASLVVLFSALTVLYFLDLLFNAFMIFRTFSRHPEFRIEGGDIAVASPYRWPTYTIFCPLYKEWQVVPQFAEAMQRLDYPKDRLQIIFLLEENDQETIEKVRETELPPYFEIVVVPHSKPKTKPKAMNYGLKFARGEFLVVYDAEDKPEPDQLKKAVLAFRSTNSGVACVQAKLNFYNPRQNLLTRLFTAEYSLWFDLVLPGLQSIAAPIPLGGTSNHFRTETIKLLKGWDAFNVTEDCDLGMRLAGRGYKTAIVDSTTYEEANSHFGNWLNQRSRWIKGYIITYFVHMRSPLRVIREGRWRDLLFFQFVVGGKVTSLFINPIMWVITLCYFLFRDSVGPFIETLFPGPILYIGVFSFLVGNFLYLYYYMIGCMHRKEGHLVKYVFFVPLYWMAMSIAAWKAAYEVVVKPHYWAKTRHGLHLSGAKEKTKLEPQVEQPRKSKNHRWAFLTSGAGMLVISSIIANILNLAFNIYLGRELSLEDFGTVTIINTFANLVNLFTGAMGTTMTRTVSFLEGRRARSGGTFFRSKWLGVFMAGVLAGALWLFMIPTLSVFFQVSSYVLLAAFTPTIFLGLLDSANRGYLQGSLSFRSVAALNLFEVIAKLLAVVVLVVGGLSGYAALAIPLSVTLACIASTAVSLRASGVAHEGDMDSEEQRFPLAFYGASLLSGVSVAAFLSMDLILAKHYLTAPVAGEYSLLSLVGKMIFFFGSLLNVFVVVLVSRSEGRGKDPKEDFRVIFSGTLFLTISAVLGLNMFGGTILPLLLGERIISILPYVPMYSFAIALFTITSTIVLYHLARKRYIYSAVSFLAAALMCLGIIQNHASIGEFVEVITLINVAYVISIAILFLFVTPSSYAYRNLLDGMRVFRRLPLVSSPAVGKMRILIFNWRDRDSSFAGGAETYIQTLATRFVAIGHQVTLFTSNDGTQKPDAVVEGVQVVRRGGFYGVYALAALYYVLKFRGKYDAIIDCENGIPFFTPLYAKEPVFCLVHHIHQDVFRRSLSWPLAKFASFLEGTLMPIVYRDCEFITVSESSRHDMESLRITDRTIRVVYPGVDLSLLKNGERSPFPLISYVGRLKDYKSVHLLIHAFVKIVAEIPGARLVIAGDGEERLRLVRLARRLGVFEFVSFPGKVSEEEKISIMQRSWVFVNPSMMEGWGITTIEANACGTPVVASDVPGLRESVRHEVTGLLVPYGNTDVIAGAILSLITDTRLRTRLAKNAVEWAAEFDWGRSTERFIEAISTNDRVLSVDYSPVQRRA